MCSIDGINIQPNISRNIEGAKDWPHCDQTKRDDIFKCVQGQAVLTNTSAAFRASPTSHKYFREIMKVAGIPDNNSNWAKFTDDQLAKIKRSVILPNKVPFQVPIKAEKGSIILWLSTTVHSAMSASFKEMPTPEDPFKGWRGVAYVCYRPKSEFTSNQLKVLDDCLENNRGVNHWATKVYSSICNGPYARKQVISPTIQRLVDDPKLIYEVTKFKPSKGSCLINEPITVSSYEEVIQKAANEGHDTLKYKQALSSISNENEWPSLGQKGNGTENNSNIKEQQKLSVQGVSNRNSKVSRVQGAAWKRN